MLLPSSKGYSWGSEVMGPESGTGAAPALGSVGARPWALFGEEAKSTWPREFERDGAVEDVGETRAEIMLREFIILSPRSHEEKRVRRESRYPASQRACPRVFGVCAWVSVCLFVCIRVYVYSVSWSIY